MRSTTRFYIVCGLVFLLIVGICMGGVWAMGGMFEPRPIVADGIETENPEVTVYYDTDFNVVCWLYQPTTSSAGISCLSVTDLNILSDGYRTLPR